MPLVFSGFSVDGHYRRPADYWTSTTDMSKIRNASSVAPGCGFYDAMRSQEPYATTNLRSGNRVMTTTTLAVADRWCDGEHLLPAGCCQVGGEDAATKRFCRVW